MTDANAENHKRFLKHLEESEKAVWTVAKWLRKRGNNVVIPCATKAETYDKRYDNIDNGDLYLQSRIEVKRRNVAFTSAEDWPYETFIVCAVHSFDKANPKPFMYVCVNKAMTHAGLIQTNTSDTWMKEMVKDGRYIERTQECYTTTLDNVQFITLNLDGECWITETQCSIC